MAVDLFLGPSAGPATDLVLYPDGPRGPTYTPTNYARSASVLTEALASGGTTVAYYRSPSSTSTTPPQGIVARSVHRERSAIQSPVWTPIAAGQRQAAVARSAGTHHRMTITGQRQPAYSREAREQQQLNVTAFIRLLANRRPVRLELSADKRAALRAAVHEALRT